MGKIIIRIMCVIVAVCIVIAGFCFYKMSSPEYMLLQTIKAVKASGVEGLRGRLTENAQKTVDKAVSISQNAIVSGILSAVSGDEDKTGWLLSKLSDMEFTVDDVLKGKKSAEVVIGFRYGETVSGTVGISLVRENMQWKIDGLKLPHFDSF